MKKRFSPNRICSSDNYLLSKQIHRNYIRRWHAEHSDEILVITQSISIHQRCYVKCFEKLVEISEDDAIRLETCMTIIRK